ncbi:hypothetical protein DZE40_004053 [Clostridium beijerinckii]|uniref:Uncharacterized protein n=1 Tax=Clostridium beijerinckii TaxID=1520 RepID=A0A1S8S2G1_CLOBE|nr:hypothetical protein [Clostridium beijerinckii]OOM59661.1 hypothetical protein CLBCK_33430 [Clostridium beijerinckii]
MAVNKVPNSASLSIEVQKDVDKADAQLTQRQITKYELA